MKSGAGFGAMTTGPTPIQFDSRTALIVVDMQNDFAHPNGQLYVRGSERLVSPINELIDSARRAGAFVIDTQDWHPPSTPHFRKDGGRWPVHCVQGTWGAEFACDLVINEAIVRKGAAGEDGYSGFTMRDPETNETRPTKLESCLREHATEHVVIVGVATDWCVKHTALDSCRLGFRTTVIAPYTAPVDVSPGDEWRALQEMQRAGVEVL